MNRWMLIAGLLAVALTGCASAGNPKINRDPFYESFFEKASLIMTKEEIEIYKHLPDDQERRDFIVEFWKSRDPYPETPGNEFKIEFEQRIAYANRWFRENQAAGRGWNTERGRILLLLGQPEKREWQDDIGPQQAMQMGLPSDVRGVEVWTYYDLQLQLIFVDAYGNGQYRMRVPPVELLSAIDVVKSNMNMGLKNVRNLLKFDVSFKEGQLRIDIPVKKISFQEKEGKMTAAFRVKVTLYKDYVKKDSQTTTQTLSEDKEQLLNKKTLQIAIPYDLKEKGKYYFEIVLVNLQSGSAYRHYLNYKI